MKKAIWSFEFVQGVNFEFKYSFKKTIKRTWYSFSTHVKRFEICNSKAFVDAATAERHRWLSTIHNKQSLFPRSKLGWDIELQNTQIIPSESPRDVIQTSTHSAQFGLGSEVIDWYRDSTSVQCCQLWIDLLSWTDNWLSYCKNTGFTLSNS